MKKVSQNSNSSGFNDAMHDKMHSLAVKPPAGSWMALSNKLGNSSNLVSEQAVVSSSYKWRYSIAALLLISISFALWQVGSQSSNSNFTAEQLQYTHPNSISSGQNAMVVDEQFQENTTQPQTNVSQTLLSANNSRAGFNNKIKNKKSQNLKVKPPVAINNALAYQENMSYQKDKPIYTMALAVNNIGLNGISELYLDGNKDAEAFFNHQQLLLGIRGFHFGPNVSLNNTWLFVKNANRPAIFSDELQYNMAFRISYGFSVGYDFNHKFGLQTELIASHQGQRYSDDYWDVPVEGDINLHYVHIPLIAKYKFSRINEKNRPSSINYLVGLQYSKLQRALINVNGTNLDGFKHFSQHDMGLTMGLEKEVFIGERTFLSMGARATYSGNLNNFPLIFNQSNPNPNNLLIGVNVAVKYLAPVHKKLEEDPFYSPNRWF